MHNSDKKSTNKITLGQITRRRLLLTTGAGVAVTGLGVGALAQEEENTIELGGKTSGWVGRVPSDIEGETNPTITVVEGETYTLMWENTDGLPHNIVINDAEGNQLERTEIVSTEGETQTLEFTASGEMAEYRCEVHPDSMVGDIAFEEAEEPPTEEPPEEPEPLIPEGPTVGVETVAEGLNSPTAFKTANEADDRRFIADQTGQIYVYGPDGLEDEPFLDISDRLVDVGRSVDPRFDDRGLLGIAFHPNFDQNEHCKFYVRYSAPPREGTPDGYDHIIVLSEFRTMNNRSRGDPTSERVLIEEPSPQFNHNAGAIEFGPDGYLYVPMGDGGNANDVGLGHVEDWYDDNEGGNGQDTTQNLLGGILRIDVDSTEEDKPYGIPDDNPLVDQEDHLSEYYAWGMRNPRLISFDSEGRLFVADVGQDLFEEVNLVEKGGNYGWNVKEGTHCFSTDTPDDPPEDCPDSTPEDVRGGEPLLDPIIEYPHTHEDQTIGIAVTGGHVYEADTVEALEGKYVFGDWSTSFGDPDGSLFVATESEGDDMWSIEELTVDGTDDGRLGRYVLSFGRDQDGELYVLTNESSIPVDGLGAVHKIVPA